VRWLFTEDNSAIQVCHISTLKITRTGHSDTPFGIMAHVIGQASPVAVDKYATRIAAVEAIKDIVVGRERRREQYQESE